MSLTWARSTVSTCLVLHGVYVFLCVDSVMWRAGWGVECSVLGPATAGAVGSCRWQQLWVGMGCCTACWPLPYLLLAVACILTPCPPHSPFDPRRHLPERQGAGAQRAPAAAARRRAALWRAAARSQRQRRAAWQHLHGALFSLFRGLGARLLEAVARLLLLRMLMQEGTEQSALCCHLPAVAGSLCVPSS